MARMMDTGPHFSMTALALRNIEWFPQDLIVLKTIQAFNWFPDFLSIIDLYKMWFFPFGWLDYIPLYVPTYGFTEFRAFKTYYTIKLLSANTLAGKYYHKCHFDNLFSFNAVFSHWNWLKKQVKDFLSTEVSSIKTLAVIGNSLHAVQDFYSHSNWVEFFAGLGIKTSDIPSWSEVFILNEQKWNKIREQLYATSHVPVHTIFTGYYKPEKILPRNAYHHDDKKNSKPGLNKDKPSRPYFELSYTLAIRESVQWLQQLYKDNILTDEHITALQDHIPADIFKKIDMCWERAQTLSKKTKHWNGGYPFPDLNMRFLHVAVVNHKARNYIQGNIVVTTSENLTLTKRNFQGAYILIITKHLDATLGQTIVYPKKNGLAQFKIAIPNTSNNKFIYNKYIQLEAHYGTHVVSTSLKLSLN